MTLKIPTDTQAITWLIIGIFSAWGGVVRYLMDMQGHRGSWSWMGIISQIIISSFTGLLGGLLSFENGSSHYMTFAIAGLFGTLGSTALSYLWRRFLGSSEKNRG
ncbi:phage holin family protein [Yersinia nurmii]|uniref:Phage holin family protein n=1 Tax=Yersinia nurmii TaxID=685706 RepID=A0AAW7KB42_9GAMM|nr:phage holin family protein [Yersinia nurmii]MDN0089340.1 phage holin family protein [Yersinia nurmii]CNE17935.1 putative phage-like protein [Yersinia nurmii]